MKKNLLIIAAIASATLVSCSSDEFGGEENYPIPVQDAPIAFGSYFKAMTRADVEGAEAAALLGNTFVVSGYKGTSTATPGSIVFDNYKVVWQENTANTTESNSSNWEYVGVTPIIKHATDHGITAQKIKYWDYSQPQYDFIAWSTGLKTAIYEGTPATGEVLVSAITPTTATGDNGVAYTFEGKAADLRECYIADLVTVNKTNDPAAGVGELGGYNQPVTFKFRQLGTKVRIALYETVPGYSVKDVQFYSAAASDDASAAAAKLFTTTANSIYTEGKYTVYFPTVDAPTDVDNNQAHIKFDPKLDANNDPVEQSTVVNWGTVNYTIAEDGEKSNDAIYLGRTSNTASFAGNADDNYYVVYLPNSNGTNLNLRVNYTLESTDGSGEVITVKGATAQVPSIYTQWKPGFAYTYLFKISDKTNGYTGVYDPTDPDNTTVNSDPAGLYPITFDAVVVNAEEDKTQETITTVSTPSITTYQNGSDVVNNNEYTVLTPSGKVTGEIYVTVNDGNTGDTPDLANGHLVTMKANGDGMANLYEIAAGTTEALVVDALQIRDDDPSADGNIMGRNGLELIKTDSRSDKLTLTDKVQYGADGNEIELTAGQAAKFIPQSGKTYAFVYFKTIKTTDTPLYQPIAFDAQNVSTKYRYAYKATAKTHTYNDGTTDVDAYDAQKGHVYFTENQGTYSRVVEPFIGQGVNNLYLDAQGTTIASGYAVTGTTYYYSYMDGQTKKYEAAHEVKYADFENETLYVWDATANNNEGGYVAKTDNTPVDGTAYYYEDGGKYIYCVILPQQVNGTYELDTAADKVVATETTAVDGQTYFDKYIQNNGVYYAKVIKVQ